MLTPEQQVTNVQIALAALRAAPRHRGRADAIRATERQLAELLERHLAGELAALNDDTPC